MLRRSFAAVFAFLSVTGVLCSAAPNADIFVSLCDPAKLATLRDRGANPRVQKIVYWLETARRDGQSPEQLMSEAMSRLGWGDERGRLTTQAMVRNLEIATRLGCTDDEGMANMRRGKCPIIKVGPYVGDWLSVDHIVPRARYPELDNVLANLEMMPMKLNRAKGDSFGARQQDELNRFESAGLVSKVAVPVLVPASGS